MINALHGSVSPEASEREIELIFPHILQGGDEEEREKATHLGNVAIEKDDYGAAAIGSDLNRTLTSQPESSREYLQKYVCPILVRKMMHA